MIPQLSGSVVEKILLEVALRVSVELLDCLLFFNKVKKSMEKKFSSTVSTWEH
jgi:hypothetical protein